ncbi:hypothetical protein BST81_20295 [Leptolyngbya sp. 'hensonii']|uniref:HesB/IscA family protein n=1 Tax=Leptolyngbya sp. 'hensonii' TaxID=1922337 RepID=UPI00094FA4CD|nr:iron-sulfur cluster assembly accessory protein [Leptolyngbya sp. 'hensonii']OLP16544.1 hypothetical protein BST81_20295 [Leptolyngbya sp. 'hensonii']
MIHLSKTAIKEVMRLKSRNVESDAFFRVSVQVGGCLGLSYTMQFVESAAPDDRLHNAEGIQIAIDAQSFSYLDGLTLDYSEDLMGGAFRFHNPNAAKHCDCGGSFSIVAETSPTP